MSPTLIRGSSEPTESWKTICMWRRISFSDAPLRPDEVDAVEADLARRRLEQPQQRPSERRLAAPGLAHEADRLSRVDVQVDAVDRLQLGDGALQHPLLDGEVLPHAARLEQGIARAGEGFEARAPGLVPGSSLGAHEGAPSGCTWRAPSFAEQASGLLARRP